MLSLIKTFGKGLLYVISLPLTLLILAGFMVYGVFYFLFLSGKSLILFFKGKTIYSELDEDIKAKEILTGIPHQTVVDPFVEMEEETKEEPSLEIPMYTIPSVITLDTNTNKEETEDDTPIEEIKREDDTPKFEALEEPEPIDTEYSKITIGEEEEIPVSDNNSKRIFDDDVFEDDIYGDDTGVTFNDYDEEDE